MTSERRLRILLGLANADRQERLGSVLRHDGHVVDPVDYPSLRRELGLMALYSPHPARRTAVVLEARLAGRGGLDVLASFQGHAWSPPFVLVTTSADDLPALGAPRFRPHATLDGAFDPEILRATLTDLARKSGVSVVGEDERD